MALTLFRAFSAESLVLRLPGPMAQAITFRAFGAPICDTASSALGNGGGRISGVREADD
ncbi:MAG TPA: hypothetical protein VN476_18165 [Pyrinomonadaceae bacterium]|nr:hypothetical protein [Pyrinomonadaceae bacterium]